MKTKTQKNDREIKHLICIECPRGCDLEAVLDCGEVKSVTGNFCAKGKTYAQSECVNPVRIITTTIRIDSQEMLPVKTDKGVSKSDIMAVMQKIKSITASRPIKTGDILASNVDGNGTNVLATKTVT